MIIIFIQESILRAVQYLPDIATLQHKLYSICNHRLDLQEVDQVSMDEFLQRYIEKGMPNSLFSVIDLFLNGCTSDQEQMQYFRMVKSFCDAWNMVKSEVSLCSKYIASSLLYALLICALVKISFHL